MHNVLDNVDKIKLKSVDLDLEYKNALKDTTFKKIVTKLKLSDDYLKNYTSFLEDSVCEYKNCMECKNLNECKNKINGYAYLPKVSNSQLVFEYKPCRYKCKLIKDSRHLKNIKYYGQNSINIKADIKDIYKNDKNRFEVINYLLDFLDKIELGEEVKGLYLHGNFGCGKSYLITALFNELAKLGYESAIVFWPEFLRDTFSEDFSKVFESVKKVPLLLIDDIGAENNTAWNRDEVLCPLLQYRMDNNLVTFFTSNLNQEQLQEHLASSRAGADEIKAGRIISRIEQLTTDLEMISKNLRK